MGPEWPQLHGLPPEPLRGPGTGGKTCNFRGKLYRAHVDAETSGGDVPATARPWTSAPAWAEVREMPGSGFGGLGKPSAGAVPTWAWCWPDVIPYCLHPGTARLGWRRLGSMG